MAMTRRVVMVALAAGCALAAGLAHADQPSRPATKLDLTRESGDRLHALIRPHASEWRHLQVNWLTDVVAARKKAAAEDKPIVICYTGGAGYNEPLGVC
jgi:hypothetical protein